jgi:hypothetical protein
MCRREGTSLQAGTNFGLGGNHSVIPMSVRPNAPYRDRLGSKTGATLIYEGHDEPKGHGAPNPKLVDSTGIPRFRRADTERALSSRWARYQGRYPPARAGSGGQKGARPS